MLHEPGLTLHTVNPPILDQDAGTPQCIRVAMHPAKFAPAVAERGTLNRASDGQNQTIQPPAASGHSSMTEHMPRDGLAYAVTHGSDGRRIPVEP